MLLGSNTPTVFVIAWIELPVSTVLALTTQKLVGDGQVAVCATPAIA